MATSKEKYNKCFSSNIFFNSEPETKVIKVNRKENSFIPKYQTDQTNSLQRKILQLKGQLSTTNSTTALSSKIIEDNKLPASSFGYYKKEQCISHKPTASFNAKERYYAMLSNTQTRNDEVSRCNSMINFTNERISNQYDSSKVVYKNDSRAFLYDNLYSNKIFPNDKTRQNSAPPKKEIKEKTNLFTTLSWGDTKKEYNPKKVKHHTNFETQTDWKGINTELYLIKKNKGKYSAKEFKQQILRSSMEDSESNGMEEGSNNSTSVIQRLKNNNRQSQDKRDAQEQKKKALEHKTFNAKDRKAYELGTSSVFDLEKKENGAVNKGKASSKEKFVIEITNELQSSDVKKLLVAEGLHVYNIQEKSKWTNGNENTKVIFQVRNGFELDQCKLNLQNKGINLTKQEDSTLTKDSEMFPVQAKWCDNNIRNYHTTSENMKKPEVKDYNLKSTMHFDKNLTVYKNDKIYSNKTREKKESIEKIQSVTENKLDKSKKTSSITQSNSGVTSSKISLVRGGGSVGVGVTAKSIASNKPKK